MTHKAGSNFFEEKRPWSERKDQVLGYYLKPYLPKIAVLGRPICVVDGFAGPGKFGDGKPGSPVIICRALEEAKLAGLQVSARALCVERDSELFAQLKETLAAFTVAELINGSFQDVLQQLVERAKRETVLLYLDPFTVTGLRWSDLDRVFRALESGSSVELLLNFSGTLLARVALAILKLPSETPASSDETGPELVGSTTASGDDIDAVLGGDWWRKALQEAKGFPAQVDAITRGYCSRLKARFAEVCSHDIRQHSSHAVPKYTLIFSSRHPDALELMNEAMIKSRDRQAMDEKPVESTLFETRPLALVPDLGPLPEIVLNVLGSAKLSRGELIQSVIRAHFCVFTRPQIRGQIESFLKSGKIVSSTGKPRINDDVLVWRSSLQRQ